MTKNTAKTTAKNTTKGSSYIRKKPIQELANKDAWQKRPVPPLPQAVAAEEVTHLLALVNGAELVAANRSWHFRARQLLPAAKHREQKREQKRDSVPFQGRWSLLLSLGGVECLCRAELPSGVRAELEALSEPWRLEELPASVVAGLLSLALSPVLQELLLVPCRVLEHSIGVEEKVCAKHELAFLVEVLPVAPTSSDENEGAEEGEEELGTSWHLQIFLARRDLAAVGRALRVRRWSRHYPPNLHTTWQLEGGSTGLSLEEFRALREGDVLLLS